ncbi:peptidylprolyl isomerase [Psychromonas sp. psych-6C06]|uniref:FKBP-type peptidyl-prolyl cis-trans isomerase n=1 Tax=Psychromonas sp. psych-6C06 TaxID=2058089 RepID=UPI000C33AC0A|nr:FKBP-type peptidyl-prolyl cis-trans isomerase [Psychromonas sp. psych-6C06]PKF61205.1 peptidylprolyl isomerase [Psychromonas sp. psych-6C06]
MKVVIVGLILVGLFFLFKNFMASKNAPQNIQIGVEFLAENGQKEGVHTTESGLQYEILSKGDGSVHPTAKSKVTVHYHGTLIDGSVFDSSVERDKTISFKLNQVIKGWTEGLQLMVVGDKYRFYIPSSLAYGNSGVGAIPAGSLLIFDVELFSIN